MARAPVHYTKLGRVINMQALASKHANKPALAVGNLGNFNARGDLIDKGGKVIIKTQEQIVAEFKRLKDLQDADEAELFDVKDPSLKIENAQFEPIQADEASVDEPTETKQETPQPKRRKIVEAD